MKIGGWLNLEMNTKQRARAGRFYLDGVNGAEISPAATITEGDGTVRIEIYRYVLGEARLGGTFFMPRREDIEVAKKAADALLEVFAEDDGNEAWFLWSFVSQWGGKVIVSAMTEDAARAHLVEEAGEAWGDTTKVRSVRIGRGELQMESIVCSSW
jgi:hypothetical protein